MTRLISLALFTLLAAIPVTGVSAQEPTGPGFGGPNAVENQVESDFGETWDALKQNLKDDLGLVLSVDYTAVMLTANETFDDKNGTGGIARIFGTFDLFNIENGTLVWKFEHRHAYGSVSPFDFSLGQIGYVGLQEPPFNDTDFRTQNLYWRQRMNDGRSTLIVGVLDATDYLDAYALASPWLHFMNFAFSTGSATIGLPNDAAVGVAFGTMLTDRFYLIVSDNEYFASVELGYTSSHERIILDNYHVTVWHKDRQDAANIPSGWGINFSASRYLNDNFMPFLRGGYTEDAGSLLESSISAGIGYNTEAFNGLFGAAVNWGSPNEDTFGPDLDDQFALEVFYRAAAGKRLALTVDLQYIQDPAINPFESSIWMFNLRGRVVF
jgi:porin